ncbi:serine/threonine-protein phosphatase 2B regulatory subunit [Nematocida sp. ERTm5]|nr:serine/threonine-protein phosphatase 2B regulatory subunit [Nematocida sp. AWRm79]KAI5183621.1 serine/threonine-protein phosphatase 2B regulatory subunit [Nematocida sp. AWRm78]OAG33502.1 serine/threonine-protein phosphatase 2B regulatory subunit [Nematocida sp. ERTm5]
MGTVFSGLTKEDIKAVKQTGCRLPPKQIKLLYKRFKDLDKEEIGRIFVDQLLCIPEISINPLGEKVARKICDEEGKIDFNGFVSAVTIFSKYSTNEEKVRFFFDLISTNGRVTRRDLEEIASNLYPKDEKSEEIQAGIDDVFKVYDKQNKNFIECKDLKGMDCNALGKIF